MVEVTAIFYSVLPFFRHRAPTSARAILHHTDQKGPNILKGSVQTYYHQLFSANYPELTCWNILTWIPSIILFVLFFVRAIGVLPVMHMLIAELFPTEIRTQSIGITESITLASGALAIKLFPNFKEAIGLFGICCLFCGFTLILIIWGACTIPDNRGKSLVKVEEIYEETKNTDIIKDKKFNT